MYIGLQYTFLINYGVIQIIKNVQEFYINIYLVFKDKDHSIICSQISFLLFIWSGLKVASGGTHMTLQVHTHTHLLFYCLLLLFVFVWLFGWFFPLFIIPFSVKKWITLRKQTFHISNSLIISFKRWLTMHIHFALYKVVEKKTM